MQRELYEVEKDRFDLKDSSLYHLQGIWPKNHKPEAVLDGEKLPAAISAQERVSALERFKDLDLVTENVCRWKSACRIWRAKRSLLFMR